MISRISYSVRKNQLYRVLYNSKRIIIFGILLGFFISLSQGNIAFADHCTRNQCKENRTDAVGVDSHICKSYPRPARPIAFNPRWGPCPGCHRVWIMGDITIILDRVSGKDTITIMQDDTILFQGPKLENTEVILDENWLNIIQYYSVDLNVDTAPSPSLTPNVNIESNISIEPNINIESSLENNELKFFKGKDILFWSKNIELP